jgi:hypothetical protein
MMDDILCNDKSLPVPALERIEKVCHRFEAAWKQGDKPRIEEYLDAAQGAERGELLRELLLLDLDYCNRSGQQPTADEYQARFPQDSQLIREVFDRRSADGAVVIDTETPASSHSNAAKLARQLQTNEDTVAASMQQAEGDQPRSKRFRWLLAAILAVCLLIAGVAAALLLQSPDAVSHNTVDLLAVIDPQRDGFKGTWTLDGQGLGSSAEPTTLLQIPYQPPEEYDLLVSAERVSGDTELKIGLVVGGRQCSLTIDSWPNKDYLTGIQLVDRVDIEWHIDGASGQNPHRGQVISLDHPVELACSVRNVGAKYEVKFVCDGRSLFEWTGHPRQLSLGARISGLGKDTLFLSTVGSRFQISQMKLVPISGPGQVLSEDASLPRSFANAATVSFTAPDREDGLRLVELGDGQYSIEQADGNWMICPENYLYFQVDDSFAYDVRQDAGDQFVVDLTVFDLAPGWIDVEYDGHPIRADRTIDDLTTRYTPSTKHKMSGSAQPVDIRFQLPLARLANQQNAWSDFRVRSSGQKDAKIYGLQKISVTRIRADEQEQSP